MGPYGYLVVKTLRRQLKVHQVIWCLQYGVWPQHQIDHVNRDRSDNKISNLRAASNYLNQGNRGLNRNNTSGYKGVTFNKKEQAWRAIIRQHGGKRLVFWGFKTPEEAARRYDEELVKKYGEFASPNFPHNSRTLPDRNILFEHGQRHNEPDRH